MIVAWSQAEGPRLEKSAAVVPSWFSAAMEKVLYWLVIRSPGERMVSAPGPSFPAAKTTTAPAASAASIASLKLLWQFP